MWVVEDNEQLTPGQIRTRRARLARKRNAEERRAEYLRERGWTVIAPPPEPDEGDEPR